MCDPLNRSAKIDTYTTHTRTNAEHILWRSNWIGSDTYVTDKRPCVNIVCTAGDFVYKPRPF